MITPGAAKIRLWRENAIQFVVDNFKVEPDLWQRKALDVFPSQNPELLRISLQACAGPGKSTVLAWFGWHFLTCQGEKGEHPKGAAISITADNLKDNLWPEFAKWRGRSEFLQSAFEWTKERIFAKHHPETWFLSARSYSKTANAEEQGRTLSGLHAKYILMLIDESGEIPISVLKSAEQAFSSAAWKKIAQAGNPTSHDGMLYAAATNLSHLWHVIRITGDPDDPERSPRIDLELAREQIRTYGRSDPWVMAFILGQFPPTSINTLFGPDEVAEAMKRQPAHEDYAYSQKRLGVDVARFGDDRTVIFPRQGLLAHRPVEMRSARTPEISARIAAAKAKWNSELELIDGTGGFGSGVIDSLLQGGHTPMEVHFSGKAIDPRYVNKRAEMWFEMSAWLKRGGALPNVVGLSKELTTPTYTFQNGKFQLESKEQIKKRLKFSPDLADALALTFAYPEQPASHSPYQIFQEHSLKSKMEWDPFQNT